MFSAIENSSTSPRRWRSSGMWPTPGVEHPAGVAVPRTSLPDDLDRAGLGPAQARDRVDQLALPVAVDAGDADDLARADVERDAAHLLDPAVVDARAGPRPRAAARPAVAGCFSTRSSTSRPTIARASDSSVAPSRGTVSIILPRRRTVIRSAISSTSLSLWLMKMIDLPVGLEAPDDREQLGRLLRRQHGRRLVEDEDLRAAVERLQDLDALLLADGDLARSARSGRPRARTAARARGRAPRRRARRARRRRASARCRGRCSRRPSSPG